MKSYTWVKIEEEKYTDTVQEVKEKGMKTRRNSQQKMIKDKKEINQKPEIR